MSPPRTTPAVSVGLEQCLAAPPDMLRGARVGLLMNMASVDARFRYACDLFAQRFPGQLRAIFTPQHGLFGEQQANMIESGHARYEPLGLPLYSLYSETRQPTPAMLADLDVFAIDLQDVGTRVYTLAWTIRQCLKACAAAGVRVLILDRPNPLGGETLEGPLLAADHLSFVGGAPVPLRHGLTLGEIARLVNREQSLGADLHVVPMTGWRRRMLWEQTGRTWIGPSPNMPRVETTLLYPGQVLLEGTNLSEGRGTTAPFEFVGAPFLDPWEFTRELQRYDHPGLALRPVRFVPTFDKFQGQSCGGAALQIAEARAVRSVATTLAVLAAARRLAPHDFAWLPPPYEYEFEKPPIDILFGDDRLRTRLAAPAPLTAGEIAELLTFDETEWRERTAGDRLYG